MNAGAWQLDSIGHGRIPYRIEFPDPTAAAPNGPNPVDPAEDYDGDPMFGRHPSWTDPNAWSSMADGHDDMHLPVFDVDVTPTVCLYGRTITEIVASYFTGDIEWVPSSTPGHHHVYVRQLMTWDEYADVLQDLQDETVIEAGYVRAAMHRGATFVRMPGVAK